MCTAKKEIRPGIDGIVDYVDIISEVHFKLTPVFSLIILAEAQQKIDILDNEELSHLGALLRDMLDEVWAASDGIYKLYREVHGHKEVI